MTKCEQVSVIIPTKNRPDALALAVQSVLAQTLRPTSLVIVDQSSGDESRRRLDTEFGRVEQQIARLCCLKYVHDPTISGAAAARNRAMTIADGDIWLFLDDDVYLEPDFIEHLLRAYRENPKAVGISGIITNYPRPQLMYRLWSGVFMHGPFHDARQPIYWMAEQLRGSPPIRVHRLGGGLMSFRAEFVRDKRFDENLDRSLSGVSDGEDVDFCWRLGANAVLLIDPRARLQHYHDPAGRLADHWLRRHARGNLFLYRKLWNKGGLNRLRFWWLWFGYCAVASIASLHQLSLEPWRALWKGAAEALNASVHA